MARLLASTNLMARGLRASTAPGMRFASMMRSSAAGNNAALFSSAAGASSWGASNNMSSALVSGAKMQQFRFQSTDAAANATSNTAAPAAAADEDAGSGCPFSGGGSSSAAGATTGCPMSVSNMPKGMCPVEEAQEVTLQSTLMALGKFKLSGFVSATAVAGYVLAGGLNPLAAIAVGVGCQLQSMSACTANQIWEAPYDKLMKRTAKRPLVANHCSQNVAITACVAEGVLGSALLSVFSPEAAALGALNWALYVLMYTPLKRVSAVNTWFGAIIGGIPPLMGGVAAVGGSLAFNATIGPAYLLAAYMLVWQIPHFMALSFHCRRDYESAGFKMLAFAHPTRASFYAIALSVMMVAITLLGPHYIDWKTELWYYPVTAIPGAIMIQKSVLFHQDPVRHCRGCFLFSYAYLGAVLLALSLNHLQPMHNLAIAAQWAQEKMNSSNNNNNEIVEGEKA